jgi:hypothetical protein
MLGIEWIPSHFLRLAARHAIRKSHRPMRMGEEASLLDDARFVEELPKLEALPPNDTSALPKPAPTVAENPEPVAIADELPPALGPRARGPQFVLAPPPSRRRSGSRRESSRPLVRIRMSASDDRHAAGESGSVAESTSDSASSDDGASTALTRPESNDGDASLIAFPTESATPATKGERTRVNALRRSSAIRPALAVVGFVLMMTVGAGAAALVFHDRVAQIVALWQSASR